MDRDTSFVLFYEKCRLCLDKAGLSNIFREESTEKEGTKESLDLPLAIYSCTGVKVSPKDNLPSKICESCLDVVVKAKKLKELAQKNDLDLKTLFTASEEGSNEVPGKNSRMMIPDSLIDSALLTADGMETDRSTTFSSKQRKSNSEAEKQNNISIRKDLFETSTPVTSSTSVKIKHNDDTRSARNIMKSKIETEYVCGTCSKKYETLKKLYLHQRTHNRSYACPLDACGKTFATKGDLEKHLRTHTGVKPFVCDVCDKSFAQNGTLKSHRETVHYIFTF